MCPIQVHTLHCLNLYLSVRNITFHPWLCTTKDKYSLLMRGIKIKSPRNLCLNRYNIHWLSNKGIFKRESSRGRKAFYLILSIFNVWATSPVPIYTSKSASELQLKSYSSRYYNDVILATRVACPDVTNEFRKNSVLILFRKWDGPPPLRTDAFEFHCENLYHITWPITRFNTFCDP